MKAKMAVDPTVEFNKEIKRRIVNRELMMLHGNDVPESLPPLPREPLTKTTLVSAWACDNPAIRQLGNLRRRGPRAPLSLSLTIMPGRPKSSYATLPTPQTARSLSVSWAMLTLPRSEVKRPKTAHTYYTARVRTVLNTTIQQEEKTLTVEEFERSQTYKRLAPQEDLEKLITPGRNLLRTGELDEEDFPDFLSVASGGSLSRKPIPHSLKAAARLKSGKKKGSRRDSSGSEDAQRREEVLRVIEGRWEKLPSETPTAVRIYLCANFEDFQTERQLLFKHAFPELQEFCRARHLDFNVVDVRWGAGPAVDTELITTGLHNKEILSCQRVSMGPCFVTLLGDKYGDPVVPYRIGKEEFEALKTVAEENHITKGYLLDEWYEKDDNTNPSLYTLQLEPTGKSYKGKAVKATCTADPTAVSKMHANTLAVMQECVQLAIEQGKIMLDKKHKYFKSVLEEEVSFGLLEASSTANRCFCYIREFNDLPPPTDNNAARFRDINNRGKKPQPNDHSSRNLEALKSSIRNKIPRNMRDYGPSIEEYLDEKNYEAGTYLHQFIEHFVHDMKTLIQRGVDNEEFRTRVKHHDVYQDVLQHAKLANQKSIALTGRKEVLSAIEEYVKAGTRHPFVLYGVRGSGKTTVLSKVAKTVHEWLDHTPTLIVRFLGAILETRSLRLLLQSICNQLYVTYDIEKPTKDWKDTKESTDQLVRTFHKCLEQVSDKQGADKPLMIILDGLTDLDSNFRAHTLHWLPMELPKYVHLIVSVEPDKHGVLEKLQRRIPMEECFHPLDDLDEKTVEDIFVKSLQKRNRQLTTEQRELMMRLSKNHPKPLYTYLTTSEALTWASYTVVPESRLPGILEDYIWRHLVRTENKFGHVMVENMFSYLAVSPIGLTEVELRDALSCNDEVMHEIFGERRYLSGLEVSMPSFLLCRLLNEVRLLLTERHIDDRNAIMLNHRIVQQVCSRKYFGCDDMFAAESEGMDLVCKALSEVFLQEKGIRKVFASNESGESTTANRYVTPQPMEVTNKRKLHMLPYLLKNSGIYHEIRDNFKKTTLCNFTWLSYALQTFGYDYVASVFSEMKQKDNDVQLMKQFFNLCRQPIRSDPVSLATHLLGCVPRLSDTFRYVNELIKQAVAWLESINTPVLVPILPCMPSCYDICKMSLWGLRDLIGTAKEDQLAVVRNADDGIEVWDFNLQERIFSTNIIYDKETPNVFVSEECILSLNTEFIKLWEIESGRVTYQFGTQMVTGDKPNILRLLCHTPGFHLLAIYTTDTDLNQSIIILNTTTNNFDTLNSFDKKDSIKENSAKFSVNSEILVFMNTRPDSSSDDTTETVEDTTWLNMYSMNESKFIAKTKCEKEKVFHSLLVQDDNSVIVCWKDSSFDMYDIRNGDHVVDMPPPGGQLTLHSALFGEDGNLVFLATRFNETNRSSQFSGIWKWDLEDEEITRLVLIEHNQDNHIPTHFHMTPEEQYAVTASGGGRKVSLWDVDKDEHVKSVMTHTHDLSSMTATSDPFFVYTCSQDEGVVKLWNLYRLLPRHLPPKSDITPMSILVNNESQVWVRRPAARRISRGSRKAGSVRSSKSVRFADEITDDDAASDESGSTRRGELVSFKEIEDLDIMHLESVRDDVDIWDFKPEMDAIFGVNHVVFSKDNQYLVSGSENCLPNVWFTSEGRIRHFLEPQTADDHGVAWLDLANDDNFVVALVTSKQTKKSYPHFYSFRIWELDTADPVTDFGGLYATACALSADKERVVLATVDEYDPTMETSWLLYFKVIYLAEMKTELEISFRTQTCPTNIQLTEDDHHCITNHVIDPSEGIIGLRTFALEGHGLQEEDTIIYKFKKGKKYPEYKVTQNKVLRNGIAVAVGLNGDMQLWDVQTGDYEGNLYENSSIKDTRNPALHNHGGKGITDVVLSDDGRYLLVGSEDGTASMWDVEEEVRIHTYTGHKNEVTSVCISRDNKLVFTAGNDQYLRVYQFGIIDKPILRLYLHVKPTCIKLSHDKSCVAVLAHRQSELPRLMILRLANIPVEPQKET